MTICYFSAQYLPTVGGVERYTWNLARCTVAAGHRAIVVTSALPNLPEHEIDGDGIEIYRLPVWPVMNGRFPVIKPGAHFHALTAQIWAQKLDFCVVQTRMYTQSVWAARAAKRRGIPMLVIDHSTGYMPMGNGLLGACGRLYEQVACRLVRGTGAPFYGVSAAACRWLHTFGITAAGTMPNAIDPAALEQEAAHAPDWRAKLNLGDRKIVLFVGRLIPEKGAGLLAQAVAQLPGVVLVAAAVRSSRNWRTLGPLPPVPCRMMRWFSCCGRQMYTVCPPGMPRAFPPPCWKPRPAAAPSCAPVPLEPRSCCRTIPTALCCPASHRTPRWKPSAPGCRPCWMIPPAPMPVPRRRTAMCTRTLHGMPYLIK